MKRRSKRKRKRGTEAAAASRNELDVSAVQFSYSVQLGKKEASLEEQSDRQTEGIVYFSLKSSDPRPI